MRTNTFSRFDESIPEEVVVGSCSSCDEDIMKGQEVLLFDDVEVFCEVSCLFNFYDIRREQIYLN